MRKYKGYGIVRRSDRTKSRYLIVGTDGWTVARANTPRDVKLKINKMLKDGDLP